MVQDNRRHQMVDRAKADLSIDYDRFTQAIQASFADIAQLQKINELPVLRVFLRDHALDRNNLHEPERARKEAISLLNQLIGKESSDLVRRLAEQRNELASVHGLEQVPLKASASRLKQTAEMALAAFARQMSDTLTKLDSLKQTSEGDQPGAEANATRDTAVRAIAMLDYLIVQASVLSATLTRLK